MKIQNLEQLRDLIKDGWKVDCKQGMESIWKGTWTATCEDVHGNKVSLEQGKYRLKSPKGEIIPVEYCEGELDEHTFKVGDRVRCKPGYDRGGGEKDIFFKAGLYYDQGREFVISEICTNETKTVAYPNEEGMGVRTRALELVLPKVTEPYIGMRVKRGPEWDYYDQGCGYGKVLYLPEAGDDWYIIKWDDGSEYHYKFNHGGVVEDTDYVKPKEETNLEKAKRLYPVGTEFVPAHFHRYKDSLIIIKEGEFTEDNGNITHKIRGKRWIHETNPLFKKAGGYVYDRHIYHNGKWAEIIKDEPKEEPVWNGKALECTEEDIQESVGFGTVYINTDVSYDLVEKVEENCVHAVSGVKYSRLTSHSGLWDLFLLKDNEYIRIVNKKGDVATPVSSDKQINTKQNGCKSNEVRNIDQQDRVRDQQGRESIQSRRGRATVESRPIVYKEITSHFKKSGNVG